MSKIPWELKKVRFRKKSTAWSLLHMESKRKQNKSQKHRNREQKVVSTGKNGME
jgi:hypothetical protein